MSQKGTRDMTVGSTRRHIIAFAIPIFLSNLLQQLYNTADAFIVGNFDSTESLAAVSSSGSLIFLFTGFFTGVSLGAGVLIARYYGARAYEKMQKTIHTAVALGVVTGILLSVFGIVFSSQVLTLMRTDPEVLPKSVSYFRIYFAGAIFTILYNMFTAVLNALGDSRRPLYYLIVSSCLNVVLDIIFVAVFRMGVEGAAVASVISQAVSATLCFFYLIRPGTIYTLRIREIRFHRGYLADILRYGIPTGVQNSVIGLANVIVQSNINTFGKAAMAGCGTYSKIEGFAFLPITCFAMALSTFVGQNLGAGKKDRVREGTVFGIILSVVMAEIIGALFYLFAPTLISLFDSNPAVTAFGVEQARTESMFYFLLAFSHCIAGICRGAGKATVPMFIMLGVWCVLRITYITVILRYIPEIRMIFWAYPLTWGISSVIFLFYYIFCDWKNAFNKPKKTAARFRRKQEG